MFRQIVQEPEIDFHAGSLFFLAVYSSNHILKFCFFRFRKNFSQLLEEDAINNPDAPNYLSAQAPASTKPKRHLCSVCGYISNSYCPSCGIRCCSLKTKMLRYICRNPEAVSLPCNFRRPKVDIQADFFIKLQCEIWQKSELFRFPVIFVDWKIICEPKLTL